MTGLSEYEELAERSRAHLAADPGLEELVRYATLAVNAHNTQAWRFRLSGQQIAVDPAGEGSVVRFGRGPEMPRSLRRPVADVLA